MPREPDEDFSLSPLKTFFAKVAIVTGAVMITAYFVSSLTVSATTKQIDRVVSEIDRLGMKGGPAFWSGLEAKLYAAADAPDLAPEKKEKIIDALRKLSVKYKPYLDAMGGHDGGPAKPDPSQVRQ